MLPVHTQTQGDHQYLDPMGNGLNYFLQEYGDNMRCHSLSVKADI